MVSENGITGTRRTLIKMQSDNALQVASLGLGAVVTPSAELTGMVK